MEENGAGRGKIVIRLEDGHLLTMNGVSGVLSFDDGEIALETRDGRVTVEGEALKIESLSRETGDIVIVGSVTGIFTTPAKSEGNRGFFGRMFRG